MCYILAKYRRRYSFVMTPEEAQRTQKPYRYGMILLCFGALINWIGLAENYTDPFRYAGVACIIGGAFLICTAMCCWLHVPNRSAVGVSETDDNDAIHVISVADPPTVEKPPEYDSVVILEPPCYDDAIKLNPANLLQTKYYQDVSLPNYADLEISRNINATTTSSSNDSVANISPDPGISQPNGVITTRNGTANSSSNSISQTNENVSNSCSPSTVITIEQTASDLANEHSITRKSSDCDSVASESSVLS
ncbi:uncharacterized protein LOC129567191 isoform X2 [Sitodiplosis mosellana]|uniref:uncharacterized protein LOC129567191 isoform X2 n=1 Tax=Sitodiplosis mosellana TaxID=263140 RepID=UPI002444443E|nr:uncharacterized protein LOC129567191 isoform X2 [Sitodiplosis mosellana]